MKSSRQQLNSWLWESWAGCRPEVFLYDCFCVMEYPVSRSGHFVLDFSKIKDTSFLAGIWHFSVDWASISSYILMERYDWFGQFWWLILCCCCFFCHFEKCYKTKKTGCIQHNTQKCDQIGYGFKYHVNPHLVSNSLWTSHINCFISNHWLLQQWGKSLFVTNPYICHFL